MKLSKNIAKHYREIHFGKNWTWANLKEVLSDVSWEDANKEIYGVNSIAQLAVHINYYVSIQTKVLEGGSLEGSEEDSWRDIGLNSEKDWQAFLERMWQEAEKMAGLIETIPQDKYWEYFDKEKYGSYFRNIVGFIEHSHYHLGQIVIIKKILRSKESNSN